MRSSHRFSLCHLSPKHIAAASAVFCALAGSTLSGAITFGGDFSIGTGTLEITEEISFTASSTGSVGGIAFVNWVAEPDAAQDSLTLANLSYSFTNSGSTGTSSTDFNVYDNKLTLGDVTPTDGVFHFHSTRYLNAGEVFTLHTGSWTGLTATGFNAEGIGSFTGQAFLMNGSFLRMSENVSVSAVPEPSTWAAFLGLGALGLAWVRRRQLRA